LVGRLRYFSGNQISYGLSFEKDAGEALFRGSAAAIPADLIFTRPISRSAVPSGVVSSYWSAITA
jgi:hypothetical protein